MHDESTLCKLTNQWPSKCRQKIVFESFYVSIHSTMHLFIIAKYSYLFDIGSRNLSAKH
jgi:hypothetical protein